MASAAKCIKFSTLLLVAYFAMITDAGHHMAINALLATGLLTMLLKGKHGGHGHGGYGHLSGLSHGHSFGHHSLGHSSLSGFNFPHNFGISHQHPSIGFNLNHLHDGLGNGFDLGMIKPASLLQNAGGMIKPASLLQNAGGMIKPASPLQNAGVLTHIPHLTGLKQGQQQKVRPSVPSAPLYGKQKLLTTPFPNPGHKQISFQGHIPSAPAVTKRNPFGYTKPVEAIPNPHQPFVNQFFVMPRNAADELIEILENGNAYASFSENSESEVDNEEKANYPSTHEQTYQYDPRSSDDMPYENPVPELQ